MLIPFDNQPDYARLWIYQANRNLTDAEVTHSQQFIEDSIRQWAAHGTALYGSVWVAHSRFVIVALDEAQNMASGCSIDTSTRWLKELGQVLNIDFFDRSVAFWKDNEIHSAPMLALKSLVAQGAFMPDTVVFNNMISTKAALQTQWQLKASDTWTKRYFVPQSV
jgi:hypothetical protein